VENPEISARRNSVAVPVLPFFITLPMASNHDDDALVRS
jgi:hypothetical protein